MPDYTLINTAATPGSAFVSEQVGTVTINGVVYPVMLAASKIYTGAADANGGPVTAANPLFVSVTNLPATQPVIGTVAVSNLPGTQPVSGTVTATLAASENHVGSIGGHLDNPASVLTRPINTTAYAQNNLIASSTTAGSVVVPSISVARVAAGSLAIRRLRLTTNKATVGFDLATIRVRLWSAAPTYTNGDGGAYALATGAAGFLGQFDVTLAQFADGASGVGVPSVGSDVGIKLAAGQVVYWDMQYVGTGTPATASGQTFTLTAETYQN